MAADRVCSVEGCDKRVNSRGLCKAHYVRLLRHGDALGGLHRKESLSWLNQHVGYSSDECLIWPFGADQHGYGKVTHQFSRRAHRVMCFWAHGEPQPGCDHAAHQCGNPSCVNPRHLRWSSVSENMMDRVTHGTHNRGTRHPLSKLTEDDVRAIRADKGRTPRRVFATRFGVGVEAIDKVIRKERWQWL